MKSISAIALSAPILSATSTAAVAEYARTVFYPARHCAEIVSQEYSTGGGNTGVQMLEILCKDSAGQYRGFVTSWGSLGGAFGLGRVSAVDRFDYVPSKGDVLYTKEK